MNEEQKEQARGAIAEGIVLKDMISNAIIKNIAVIESAFESLLILSPDAAYDIARQVSENISEEVADKQNTEVKKWKERITAAIDLEAEIED